MPLGDPHRGRCTAEGGEGAVERVRTCCNTGYARGVCPSFPASEGPDVVRFGIVQRIGGVATIRYVRERDHHPFDDGRMELRESEPGGAGESTLQRQAGAFLASYLRRMT